MKRFIVLAAAICLLLLPLIAEAQPASAQKTQLVDVHISPDVHAMVARSKDSRSPAEQKMTSGVLEVAKQYQVNGNTFQKRPGEVSPQSLSPIQPASTPKVDALDRVYVYLHLLKGSSSKAVLALLKTIGGSADYSDDKYSLIQAWVPVAKLSQVASQHAVASIDLIIPPGHNTGAVLSQGDSRLRSDVARAVMPTANGNGIKVGVLSDDCGSQAGDGFLFQARTANGELGPSSVALIDNSASRTHEGLAMMEIVQDVAPAAQIYFATAATGEGQFAANIHALANNGCRVITDDEIYFDEPVFEDGIVAQAVNSVATVNNVVYTSSSTNVGNSNYFGTYNPSAANQPVGNSGNFNVHQFSGVTYTNQFTFPANSNLFFVLHWDDQYGASANDYDLYLVNQANNTTFLSSTNTQNGTQNPVEIINAVNGATPTVCNLIIVRKAVSGGDPNPNARLKLAIWQGIPMQFSTAATSTWGHATAVNCLGAGAIDAQVNNYNTIEAFSSQGPTFMVQFGAGLSGGNRPLLSTRTKPDVASYDGVSTSVPGFGNFHGTSAATPHVAGLAAQLLSVFPGMSQSAARTAIMNGCIDYGAAGADNVFGAGRTDAFRTISLAQAASSPSTFVANYTTPGTTITDNTPAGITSTLNLAPPCSNVMPSSIYVSVTVDGHNKTGDLIYTLKSPDNTTITLMNRPVSGAGTGTGKNPNVVFGDGASNAIQTANPAGAEEVGFFIPANAISTAGGFGSHTLGGTWTLTASDNAAGNVGTLKDWGIYAVEGAATPPTLTINWNPPFVITGDHTLRTINVSNSVSGGCSPSVFLLAINSNEPDFGTGGGDVPSDIQGASFFTNDLSWQIRSECSPSPSFGKGRYYTAIYRVTDIGGYFRDTSFAIPVLCTPGRINPAADIPFAGLTLDVAPSPNPVLGTSTIHYTIPGPSSAQVLLAVSNNDGKWVKNLDYGLKAPGTYTISWNGTSANGTPLPNGVYAYQLTVGAPYNALKTGVAIVGAGGGGGGSAKIDQEGQ